LITEDPDLWKTDNHPAFLRARQILLAKAGNELFDKLAGGDAPVAFCTISIVAASIVAAMPHAVK